MDSKVILLDRGIFLRECIAPEEKYGGPKQSPTNSHNDRKIDGAKLLLSLTLVLLRVFPKHIFLRGVVATPLWIINIEGHITLNLQPVYRYGHPLSIDTKISTNH